MAEGLTPTERRLLAVLADGEPHDRRSLIRCLYDDEQGTVENVRKQISNLRAKIPAGHLILCEYHCHVLHYRLVRTLAPRACTCPSV